MKYFVLKHWTNNFNKIFCRHQGKIALFDSSEKALNWLKSWEGYGTYEYHTYHEIIELHKITPKYILNPPLRILETNLENIKQ